MKLQSVNVQIGSHTCSRVLKRTSMKEATWALAAEVDVSPNGHLILVNRRSGIPMVALRILGRG